MDNTGSISRNLVKTLGDEHYLTGVKSDIVTPLLMNQAFRTTIIETKSAKNPEMPPQPT